MDQVVSKQPNEDAQAKSRKEIMDALTFVGIPHTRPLRRRQDDPWDTVKER